MNNLLPLTPYSNVLVTILCPLMDLYNEDTELMVEIQRKVRLSILEPSLPSLAIEDLWVGLQTEFRFR